MNGMMKVTDHDNDCTYKEVQDFMVPSSVVGAPRVNTSTERSTLIRPILKISGFNAP